MDTIFQIIGGLCAIGSGTALPLMSIVFGSFVTGFTDFGSGRSSPADFRKDVNKLTYTLSIKVPGSQLLILVLVFGSSISSLGSLF